MIWLFALGIALIVGGLAFGIWTIKLQRTGVKNWMTRPVRKRYR